MKVLVDPATARFRDRKNQSNENVSMDHTDRLKCITIRSNIHILLRNELQKSKLVAFDAAMSRARGAGIHAVDRRDATRAATTTNGGGARDDVARSPFHTRGVRSRAWSATRGF
jgi:hypothetical protein